MRVCARHNRGDGPTALRRKPSAARHELGASRPAAVGLAGAALVLAFAGLTANCDNGAVGVDACRNIEQARCEAVIGCPNSRVETEEDVEHCKLFYRDQCLHGVADAINPDQPSVDACVTALQLARACWDAGQLMDECNAAAAEAGTTTPTLISGVDQAADGCTVIMNPQVLEACHWLEPSLGSEATGGSGQGGTAAAGGAGG